MRFIEKSKQSIILKLANETFIRGFDNKYRYRKKITFCDFKIFSKKIFSKKNCFFIKKKFEDMSIGIKSFSYQNQIDREYQFEFKKKLIKKDLYG